ncbi:MAG: GGDEF domain-containing protein, partial [Methylococcales bacterium]|nr:GGDEF domain-containing protein [Methylococcales bacterium]
GFSEIYRDEKGAPLRLVGINQDVTEREEAEAIIHNFAYFDALTQLPNRRMLTEQLKHAISFSHREQKQFAVMVMDLDKFKPVNDTLGHRAGDALLIQVAARIKARLREHDTVARLGGDEFVVLLANIHSLDDTARVANALIETLSKPFVLAQSNNVQIGTSIGIAFYPQHGIDADELIDKADIALYQAKHNGRGCFAYYDENESEL